MTSVSLVAEACWTVKLTPRATEVEDCAVCAALDAFIPPVIGAFENV
jgi:hypothetical protein